MSTKNVVPGDPTWSQSTESTVGKALRSVIWAITSIFETGMPGRRVDNYQNVDVGIITYGKHQATLASGNLERVLINYLRRSDSTTSQAVQRDFMARVQQKEESLRHDSRFKELLLQASSEDAMSQAQDEIFEQLFFRPVVERAEQLGLQSPLALACLYDTHIQGGLDIVIQAVSQKLGVTAVGQIAPTGPVNEPTWIHTFLDEREAWLNRLADRRETENRRTDAQFLRTSTFRVRELRQLFKAHNFSLSGELVIRGQRIQGLQKQEFSWATDPVPEAPGDEIAAGSTPLLWQQTFADLTEDAQQQKENLKAHVRQLVGKRRTDPPAITCLIDAYLELVDQYFEQSHSTLRGRLEELQFNIDALNQATANQQDRARVQGDERTQDVDAQAVDIVNQSLTEVRDRLQAEFNDLTAKVPTIMQEAVIKLATEWERVAPIVSSSRAAGKQNKALMNVLTLVADAAAHDVGLHVENVAVIPQWGSHYSLQFFEYANNLVVLTVPMTAFNAPWEWSLFWHEMAGCKVRQLKSYRFREINEQIARNIMLIDDLKSILSSATTVPADADFGGLGKKPDTKTREQLINLAASSSDQTASELGTILQRKEYNYRAQRLLTFGEQFKAFQDRLWQEGPQQFDNTISEGWSEDWLEELFEDAASIYVFGDKFLALVDHILQRETTASPSLAMRHPPRTTRVAVGQKLLKLKEDIVTDENSAMRLTAALIDQCWQQVKKFDQLAELSPKLPSMAALQDRINWFLHGKWFDPEQNQWRTVIYKAAPEETKAENDRQTKALGKQVEELNKLQSGVRNQTEQQLALTQKVVKLISEAIDGFLDTKADNAGISQNITSKLIELAANQPSYQPAVDKKQTKNTIHDLLGGLDYQELARLNFASVNFASQNEYVWVTTNTNARFQIYRRTWNKWNEAPPRITETPSSSGQVGTIVFQQGARFNLSKSAWRILERVWSDSIRADQIKEVP